MSYRISERFWDPDHFLNEWLKPLSLRSFLQGIWNQKAFHFRGDHRGDFLKWFSSDRMDEMLAAKAIPTKALAIIAPDDRRFEPSPDLAPQELARMLYEGGCSIVGNQLQAIEPKLGALGKSFQQWSGMGVSVNFYFTPAGGHQAFSWHWDEHDAFVLQIEGKKHWNLFEPHIRFPLRGQNHLLLSEEQIRACRQTDDFVIHPGEMIYIPRGIPHLARSTADSHSLHLTVGLHSTSWHSIAESAITLAMSDLKDETAWRVPVHPTQMTEENFVPLLEQLMKRISGRLADGVERAVGKSAETYYPEVRSEWKAAKSRGSRS